MPRKEVKTNIDIENSLHSQKHTVSTINYISIYYNITYLHIIDDHCCNIKCAQTQSCRMMTSKKCSNIPIQCAMGS